jgi:hypothetical protein
MIELFRPVDCPDCADIEAILQELVVAHKVIVVEPGYPDTPLPALRENGRTISGRAAITAYLKDLEEFVADWQRFQSDVCYIDANGQVC